MTNKPILPPTAGFAQLDSSRRSTTATRPWSGQNAGRSTEDYQLVLVGDLFNALIEDGKFDMRNLDHRSDSYRRASNKELTIHAGRILGRPVDDYVLAKLIMLRSIFYRLRLEGPAVLDPELAEQLMVQATAEAADEDGGKAAE